MHRILLSIGTLRVYSYGFMLALAFIAGTYLATVRAKRHSISAALVTDLVFYILLSAVAGARVLFVAVNWSYYRDHLLDILKVWEGGLVFYGGFLLAFGVAAWFLKKHRLSFLKIADIFSPSLAIGVAIGRIGCFLNGCCYGKISWHWGICFPARGEPPAFAQQVLDGLLPFGATQSLPVIPAQIYESLGGVAIFLILVWLERKKRPEGFLFAAFMFLYSISRFIIEGFRYYESSFVLFGTLTVSQLISALLIVASLLFLLTRSSKKSF